MIYHILDRLLKQLLDVIPFHRIVHIPQVPPELWTLLHEIAVKSLIGQLQGAGHARQSSPDDETLRNDLCHGLLQGSGEAGLGNRHLNQLLGLLRGLFRLIHMNPRALIPDIGHLEEIFIESYLSNSLLEQRFVGAGRAGGHHDAVQMVLLHRLFDLLLGILRAGVEVFLHVDNIFQFLGEFLYLRDIDYATNVDPTMADEDPNVGLLPRNIPLGGIFLFP